MKILILGAGQVGASIARQLSNEDNDVTIVDLSEELIHKLSNSMDVRAVAGFASHPEVLERAGAADADMLIAVTHEDEVNMIACEIAHSLFKVPTKIARVRNQSYLGPQWDLYGVDRLPIDVIISPELEVSRAVIRRLDVPGAVDMVPFADGQLKMVEVRPTPDAAVVNLPMHILERKAAGLKMKVIGMVHRDQFIVPGHDTVIHPSDDVYFIADSRDIKRTMTLFGHEEKEATRVVILGGGNIGLFIAKQLEDKKDTKVKIIELSTERAEEIASVLEHTSVINGSGLDQEILQEVNIGLTDTIIAVTNDDEVNVLASLLAKRFGCKRAITLVNNTSYIALLGNLGIDAIVNPRESTTSTILQYVRRGKIKNVYSIRDGAAEIIEAEAIETSTLIGKTLETLALPNGIVLGAIVRQGQVIIPERDTPIHQGDRVIILCRGDMVKKAEKIFSVSLEFF